MTKAKLTPWFSDEIKPFYIGVYEVEFFLPTMRKSHWYAYFDGKLWGWMTWDIKRAKSLYKESIENRHEKLCFRGLANAPKKFKKIIKE